VGRGNGKGQWERAMGAMVGGNGAMVRGDWAMVEGSRAVVESIRAMVRGNVVVVEGSGKGFWHKKWGIGSGYHG
jgi:hypothetical protein